MSYVCFTMNENDRNRARLRYRSHHRGTKEMDLLLGSFADRNIAGFSAGELADYETLLAEPDPDLYDWHAGRAVPPAEKMTGVMQLFIGHQFSAGNKKAAVQDSGHTASGDCQ